MAVSSKYPRVYLKYLLKCFLLLQLLWINPLFANPTLNDTATDAQVATQLEGPGVTVSNFSVVTGTAQQYGIFSGGNSSVTPGPQIGIEDGVFMITGQANAVGVTDGEGTGAGPTFNAVKGSNDAAGISSIIGTTYSDPELTSIDSGAIYDPIILQMQAIPIGSYLKISFVFASDEYPEFVCSVFNDPFGMFIKEASLPDTPANWINIGVIPGTTTPIAVNTINSGTCGAYQDGTPTILSNSQYYVNNGTGTTPANNTNLQYDGFTIPFTVETPVSAGTTYDVKIAIADAGDAWWDGALFLKWLSSSNFSADVDLELGLQANNTSPDAGDTVIFTLAVDNKGQDAAPGIQASFPLPAGFTHVSDTSGGNYNPVNGIWTIPGSLAALTGSTSIQITTTAGGSGAVNAFAEISTANASDVDSTPGNGTQSPIEDDEDTVTLTVTSTAPVLTPFVCDGTPYTVIGSPSTLQEVDRATLAVTGLGGVNPAIDINGIAYNALDNYIYALIGSDTAATGYTTLDIVRMGANRELEWLDAPIGAGAWNPNNAAGTLDTSGNYYVLNNSTLFVVAIGNNPSAGTLTYTTVSRSGVTASPYDLTYSTVDGMLYGMVSGKLLQLNPGTGFGQYVTTTGDSLAGNAGGAWSTAIGEVFLYKNNTGQLFKAFNLDTTPEVLDLGSVAANGKFDATACIPPSLTKDASVADVSPAETFSYTYTITNPYPLGISVNFTDVLPANLTYVSGSLTPNPPGSGTVSTFDSTNLLISSINIAGAGSVTFTVDVKVDASASAGFIDNQAQIQYGSVNYDSDDPDTATLLDPTRVTVSPSKDYGDAPASYGEPTHNITGLRLGASIDPDPGSIVNADASGDGADDDGVTLPQLVQGQGNTIVVKATGAGGYLQAWIDWNGDGDFDDSGEQIATDYQDGGTGDVDILADSITLRITTPTDATTAPTFARFRWSTTVGLDNTTAASDGEVEDYTFTINPAGTPAPVTTHSCTALTGAWTGSGNIWTSTSSDGVGVTVNFGANSGASWTGTATGAMNTINAWSETAVQGSPSLSAVFYWDDTAGDSVEPATLDSAKGTVTVTFDQPIENPVVHIDRVGGQGNSIPNTSIWTSTTSGTSITRLAGTPHFITETNAFYRSTTGTTSGGESSLDPSTGTSAGSVLISGIHSEIAFELDGLSVEGTGADGIELVFCAESNKDYSDTPADGGTAPDGSGTIAYGEASHTVVNDLHLGNTNDSDSTSVASANADGDGAEDDGLSTLPTLTESAAYTLQVTTTGTGTLTGWIDYDGNGTFDADESITGNNGINSTGGVVDLPVHVPAGSQGITFMRLRYSTDNAALNPSGAASDGEVEDYQITIGTKIANPADPATTIQTGSVCTVYNATGADQVVTAPATAKGLSIKLWGAGGGHEIVGSGYSGAGGYTEAQFDNTVITPGDQYTLVVGNGGNTNGRPDEFSPASVYGFGSVSGHDQGGGLTGLFTGNAAVTETDQARALAIAGGGAGSEHSGDAGTGTNGGNGNSTTAGGQPTMRGSTDVSPPYNGLASTAHRGAGGGGYYGGGRLPGDANYSPTFGNYQSDTANASGGAGYVATSANSGRMLFSPDGTVTAPNNTDPDYIAGIGVGHNSAATTAGGNGLAVLCWQVSDYSDAPQTGTSYGTAEHTILTGLQLGPTITEEVTAYDSADAFGDDSSDDGVRLNGTTLHDQALRNDSAVTLTVTTQGSGRLHGWIDWDRNGVFGNNVNELIISEVANGSGIRSFSVTPPNNLTPGISFARFRYSTDATAANPTGTASDGEVEDYRVTLSRGFSISGRVFKDTNVDAINDAAETGITELPIVLYDTVNGTCVSTRTNANGDYIFNDITPGDYQVYEASRESVPIPQNCGPANARDPGGYLSTTANVSAAFTVSNADISDIDFGGVKPPVFELDNTQTILPNSVVLHPHVFTALTDGSVSFAIATETADPATLNWSHQLLLDANCDGLLSSADGDTAMPASINVTAGQQVCVLVKVLSPANVTTEAVHILGIQSEFTYGNGSILSNHQQFRRDSTRSLAGTTTEPPVDPVIDSVGTPDPVSGEGKLSLVKSVWNASRGTTIGDNDGSAALPGEILLYTISYENIGNGPLKELIINDSVPAFTRLIPASMLCTDKPAELPLCAANDSLDGSLHWGWAASDKLLPGSAGSVSYQVVVE